MSDASDDKIARSIAALEKYGICNDLLKEAAAETKDKQAEYDQCVS
ncbi:hypothetical protein CCACVL1_22750 [Corchorus capsularis]|uniref:Uncharacterized protein n=1 Tax=Corchorus capsularis TaxID=210143 RepID=A0A1R3GWQ7_COCAP|nr:hypothetical protein CCACVL1_22750 [Corchorus capsularis]